MPILKNAVLAGGAFLLAREAARRFLPDDLHGETALVTGGSRGLGLLIARELLRAGCRVAIYARDSDELQRAEQALRDGGGEVATIVYDLGKQGEPERLIADVSARFGRLDILVNNAGVIQVGPLENQDLTDFQMAMDVMYWAMVRSTLAVLPQMRSRQSGRIVNVTSIGGRVGVPHLMPYSGAKFAAVGFSEGQAAEVAKDGVTVATVIPGLLRTGSHLHALTKGNHEAEYGWFSLGASLPIVAIGAERAARQVVTAIRRRESVCHLGILATLADRFHGLFPGTTVQILGLVNRLLPAATPGPSRPEPGAAARDRLDSRLHEAATSLGQRAAEQFNETRPTVAEERLTRTGSSDRPYHSLEFRNS